MKLQAIVTQGISASGKTTWAKDFVFTQDQISSDNDWQHWQIICRDDIRKRYYERILTNRDKFLWRHWDFKYEKEVSEIQTYKIIKCSKEEMNIIISDTNVNPIYYNNLLVLLSDCGYNYTVKQFHISFEEACRRDAERANGVGYSVIAKQLESFNTHFPKESDISQFAFNRHDDTKKSAIIVDLDGTLAKNVSGRSPYDWLRTGEDAVHNHIKEIVNNFSKDFYEILVVSGRDEVCRKITENWLTENEINYDHLFMRTENDHRDDVIVKRELFDQYIGQVYSVFVVIDDQPKVCRMFRDMGLTVLQCGNPYIEF